MVEPLGARHAARAAGRAARWWTSRRPAHLDATFDDGDDRPARHGGVARPNAPRWAIVDEQNTVLVFVTPQSGLNLAPLVGQQVSVRGAQGYMPEYKRPYMVASEARPRLAATQRATARSRADPPPWGKRPACLGQLARAGFGCAALPPVNRPLENLPQQDRLADRGRIAAAATRSRAARPPRSAVRTGAAFAESSAACSRPECRCPSSCEKASCTCLANAEGPVASVLTGREPAPQRGGLRPGWPLRFRVAEEEAWRMTAAAVPAWDASAAVRPSFYTRHLPQEIGDLLLELGPRIGLGPGGCGRGMAASSARGASGTRITGGFAGPPPTRRNTANTCERIQNPTNRIGRIASSQSMPAANRRGGWRMAHRHGATGAGVPPPAIVRRMSVSACRLRSL